VAGRTRAQFGDVLGFGKVHFEEAADARGQRQQIECGLRRLLRAAGGDLKACPVRGLDRGAVAGRGACFGENVDPAAQVG
jgi:hypothetical protein